MLRHACLAALAVLAASPAAQADGRTYTNARFGYTIHVPDGFGRAAEADNGDGITVPAAKGGAELRVWGSWTESGSFAEEASRGIALEGGDGWTITYRSVKANGASWSGTRPNRIFYARAIPLCGKAIGTLRLEYPAGEKAAYDKAIGTLVGSFRRTACE